MSEIPAAQGGTSTPAASTNLSTDAVATQEVTAGDSGPVLFDDLHMKKGDMKKAAKEVKDDTAKEDKKEKEKSDAKTAGKEKEDKEVEGDKAKKAKADAADDKAKAKPKTVKARVGDKDTELDESATFTHKVDGKDEQVSLRKLLDDYSGRTSWDRKFSKLDVEQKQFKSNNDKVTAKVKAIFEEPDAEMRFYHMAELSGEDPVQVRHKFLQENIKLLEKYYTMTEAEREADAAKYETRVLQHRNKVLEEEKKAETHKRDLDAQIQNLATSHKFTRENFETRQSELQALKEQGKIKDEITPKFVAETLQKERLWESADKTMQELGHEFANEEKARRLYNLVEMAFTEGIPASEIPDLVKMTWPKSKSTEEIVEEKVQERQEFLGGSKKDTATKGKHAHEAMLFDDL